VTVLVEAGICERVPGGRVHPTVPLDTLVERVEGLRSRFEILRREDARRLRAVVEYAEETGCRSAALRRYFGDVDPRPCGRCDLCRAQGMAEPGRSGRRRRHRDRRHPGAAPGVVTPPPAAGEEIAAAPAERGERPRGRRRGRRGGRRGGGGPLATAPRQPAQVAAPPFALPPLDPEADDLAAELGAPGLPPSPDDATASPSPPPAPGRHRRRRRRRRGHGPRPEATSPPTPSQA